MTGLTPAELCSFLAAGVAWAGALVSLTCFVATRRGRSEMEVAAAELNRLRKIAGQYVSDR